MAKTVTIDLHVQSFMRNTSGFHAYELQELSLDYLKKSLDEASKNGTQEINVIHGRGKGVLKERVYQVLADYQKAGKVIHYEPSFFNEDTVVVRLPL